MYKQDKSDAMQCMQCTSVYYARGTCVEISYYILCMVSRCMKASDAMGTT